MIGLFPFGWRGASAYNQLQYVRSSQCEQPVRKLTVVVKDHSGHETTGTSSRSELSLLNPATFRNLPGV
jgi:hypothetical protein